MTAAPAPDAPDATGFGEEDAIHAQAIDASEVTDATGSPGEDAGIDGAELLGRVMAFIDRFVAYPSAHAKVAHTLWIAHTHLMACWESTPRLAFLSPEPGSGKTRGLEVTEPLVPNPVHAVNATPAFLFRRVADKGGAPTILFDEIDTVFGPKARENEELRAMLNSGHRQGAVAGRATFSPKGKAGWELLPSYCAVALAGLNDLPDTIMTRSVVIRMKRRSPDEKVEPWRCRVNFPEAEPIRADLEAWALQVADEVTNARPVAPPGIEDRDEDVWEAQLAVADAAGGGWPTLARTAALALVAESHDLSSTLGVQLLTDCRTAFNDRPEVPTKDLIRALVTMPESPWGELHGLPITPQWLAKNLKGFGIKPSQFRVNGVNTKGYVRAHFLDSWRRYLDD